MPEPKLARVVKKGSENFFRERLRGQPTAAGGRGRALCRIPDLKKPGAMSGPAARSVRSRLRRSARSTHFFEKKKFQRVAIFFLSLSSSSRTFVSRCQNLEHFVLYRFKSFCRTAVTLSDFIPNRKFSGTSTRPSQRRTQNNFPCEM